MPEQFATPAAKQAAISRGLDLSPSGWRDVFLAVTDVMAKDGWRSSYWTARLRWPGSGRRAMGYFAGQTMLRRALRSDGSGDLWRDRSASADRWGARKAIPVASPHTGNRSMSATNQPPVPPSEPFWAKPSMAAYAMMMLCVVLFVSYWLNNETAINLIVGASIANVTLVMGYYFGSSSGSARKTELGTQSPPA